MSIKKEIYRLDGKQKYQLQIMSQRLKWHSDTYLKKHIGTQLLIASLSPLNIEARNFLRIVIYANLIGVRPKESLKIRKLFRDYL